MRYDRVFLLSGSCCMKTLSSKVHAWFSNSPDERLADRRNSFFTRQQPRTHRNSLFSWIATSLSFLACSCILLQSAWHQCGHPYMHCATSNTHAQWCNFYLALHAICVEDIRVNNLVHGVRVISSNGNYPAVATGHSFCYQLCTHGYLRTVYLMIYMWLICRV